MAAIIELTAQIGTDFNVEPGVRARGAMLAALDLGTKAAGPAAMIEWLRHTADTLERLRAQAPTRH